MATTFEKIATVTVGSGGAAYIEFTPIAADWTDLCVKFSIRTNRTGADIDEALLTFNGSTSGYSFKYIWGFGSGSGTSDGYSSQPAIYGASTSDNANTSNTFGNGEFYIPNYASSNYKSLSFDAVSENNATTAVAALGAGLWSNTAAITSLKLAPRVGTLFVEYSSATLYGIKKA